MGFYQNFRPWFSKCYIPDVIKEFDIYIDQNKDIQTYLNYNIIILFIGLCLGFIYLDFSLSTLGSSSTSSAF